MPVTGSPIESTVTTPTPTAPVVVPTVLDKKVWPKVLAVIKKYGKLIQFIKQSRGDYDVVLGTREINEAITFSAKVSPPANYALKYIDGTSIQVGDCYIILPRQTTFTPELDMLTSIDGVKWSIVPPLKPYFGGELVVAYEVQLRKM